MGKEKKGENDCNCSDKKKEEKKIEKGCCE